MLRQGFSGSGKRRDSVKTSELLQNSQVYRDKLDAWLGDKFTREEIEKAAASARDNFRSRVNDDEVEARM